MREARIGDVLDRAALLARAHAEIDVFESVDERFVEAAVFEKPCRAHRHRSPRDAERVARAIHRSRARPASSERNSASARWAAPRVLLLA